MTPKSARFPCRKANLPHYFTHEGGVEVPIYFMGEGMFPIQITGENDNVQPRMRVS